MKLLESMVRFGLSNEFNFDHVFIGMCVFLIIGYIVYDTNKNRK